MARKSHTKMLIICLLGLIWGIGLTIAAVPLYRIFCQHFGIAVPSIVTGPGYETPTNHKSLITNHSRIITVRYTANVAGGLPVNFHPVIYSQKVKLGEPVLTAYAARNNGSRAYDGVAVHMLFAMGGPGGVDVASYVNLQQCFCFAQEHYPVGEDLQLPLSYTISPDLPAGIHTISFAYTLFEALPGDPRVKYSSQQSSPTSAAPSRP